MSCWRVHHLGSPVGEIRPLPRCGERGPSRTVLVTVMTVLLGRWRSADAPDEPGRRLPFSRRLGGGRGKLAHSGASASRSRRDNELRRVLRLLAVPCRVILARPDVLPRCSLKLARRPELPGRGVANAGEGEASALSGRGAGAADDASMSMLALSGCLLIRLL